ncbi:MAG: hypothetical protein HY901_06965, partial [Deltaproteobacteria bacterium]|nr:hypothetical protein [Deltaproteobacteria bacterium]
MLVRELYAKLGLKTDKASLSFAQRSLTEIKSGLDLIVGAAKVAAKFLSNMVSETAGYAVEVHRVSQMLGISADALQNLQEAADDADVSTGALHMAMRRLAMSGVKDVEGEMYRLADRFAAMPADGRRAALAMELFGRSGAELLPMLTKGSAAMRESAEAAQEMGSIMGEDALEAGLAFHRNMKDLHQRVEGLQRSIAGPFLKTLSKVLERLNAWLTVNKKVITQGMEKAISVVTDLLRSLYVVGRTVVQGWEELAK